MLMFTVGMIQVASNRWIGTAVDEEGGHRLIACTTPTGSKEVVKADVFRSLRRFAWPVEQATLQATDTVISVAQRLWELFQGRGTAFKLEEVSLARWTQARIEISKKLLEVPKGRVVSYGTLARMTGSSPRGVGMVMATNPVPLAVPCHRVIHADGRLGKFGSTTAGTKVKAAILVAEGCQQREDSWAWVDNEGHHRAPGTAAGSLLPRGVPPSRGAPALGLAGRRELRGDPKRLVREAGGDSPARGRARR